ncbi:MAG: aromatic acid/H+ symport family MFS transporter [Alphaproteobacteria bacterium]|nr:aromatic acid/H+ symport family MFS transporter [Alphaproteobacteria bacterium]
MADAPLSSAEHALENQRIGGLQLRVAALCTLIQICDAYDVNAIAVTVPSLTHAWGLPGPAFTQAFVWSSIGILVGALSAGPIGDRLGRRPLLLGSVAVYGLASLLTAVVGSLPLLSAMRFFTGVGIGGAFPGAATLTGDYAPARRRATMIMISFTGAPFGGFLCGQAAGFLLPVFGWQSIYVLGGIVPLAILPVLWLWLPESPRFLAAKGDLSAREAALLQRLEIAPAAGADHGLDLARGNPVKMLLGKGYVLQTVLLWIIFFCSLLNLFLFAYWLPEVLHLGGMTPAEAARASSFRELGAVFAVLYLGLAIDRFGAERALALHYAAGIVFIASIALLAMPYLMLVGAIFFAGMTIVGSQTGANGACGKLYPARMRASGLGWALGIGRLGGIVGPALGGYLLAAGLHPPTIFLSCCGFMLVAAVATALLRFRGARVEQREAMQAAE